MFSFVNTPKTLAQGASKPEVAGEEALKADPRGNWEKTLDTVPTEIGDPADCTVRAASITDIPTAGGGLFVPVHEVGTALTMLQESRVIQQELCVHLKAIRRIQYRIEEKEFIDDPNARKAAFNATVNALKGFKNQLQVSRAQAPISLGVENPTNEEIEGPPAPLTTPGYVENQTINITNEMTNAQGVFYDDLENSSENIHKDEALEILKEADTDNPLKSTIEKEDFDRLIASAEEPLSSEEYWDLMLQVANPRNNPRGSLLIAKSIKESEENIAITNARDEYQASQGFLGSRECLEWTTDGQACRIWQTISPGSIVKDYTSALLTSALRQVELADNSVEDFSIGQLARLQENGPFDLPNAGKNSITEDPDPCPPHVGTQPGSPCPSPPFGEADGSVPPLEDNQPCPDGTTGTPPNCEPIDGTPCPAGYSGTYPDCEEIDPPQPCPEGTTGTPPNCTPIDESDECPSNTTGTPPNCAPIDGTQCPDGYTGVHPNCREIDPPQPCPEGTTGTPPNCTPIDGTECPAGYTGTYPRCRPIEINQCPEGQSGIFPICIDDPINGPPTLETQYKTETINFNIPGTFGENEDTFRNHNLTVVFSNGGTNINVPGYYAGGNTWRVHFVPNKSGVWEYTATFKTGSNAAITNNGTTVTFTGSTGSITARSAASDTGFLSKGILRYVGEHYLRFDDGEYFLKAGAGSPENFLSFNGFDGGGKYSYSSHGGITGAVDYLANRGINSIYMLTMNVAGDAKDVWPWVGNYGNISTGGSPSNSQKAGMFVYDTSKLNQWNDLFNHMDSRGVMAHFLLTETENEAIFEQSTDYGDNNFDDTRKVYYREMIARFGHHRAITWNLGEENGWSDNKGNSSAGNSTSQRKAFAAYIKNLDPYNHPITVHSQHGTNDRRNMFSDLVGDQNFAGPSMQISIGDIIDDINLWRSSTANNHPWVITMDEITPHNSQHSDGTLRKEVMWKVLMNGGAGFDHYLAGQDLNFENFADKANLWAQSGHAINFFKAYNIPFWAMTPNNNVFNGLNNGWGMAKAGEAYAAYLPNGSNNLTVNLSGASGSFNVKWYDPITGSELGSSVVNGGGSANIAYSQGNKEVAVYISKASQTSGSQTYQVGDIIELEDLTLPAGTRWTVANSLQGYTGTGYITYLNDLSADILQTYKPAESVDTAFGFDVNVPTEGNYLVKLRAQHPNSRSNPLRTDTENDTWIRVKRAGEQSPTAWQKVHTPGNSDIWISQAQSNTRGGEDNNFAPNHPDFYRENYPGGTCCFDFYFYLTAGTNRIEFSARSNNHYMDNVIIEPKP